jgi:hypothetical protein
MLELAKLPIPYLYGIIFGTGGKGTEDGVEGDTGYRRAVTLENITGRGLG